METNLEKSSVNKADLSVKEWALFIFSYISVLIPLSIVTGISVAIVLAILSNLFNRSIGFESYFEFLWNTWSFILGIGSNLVTGMFIYCMVGIWKNKELSSNDKSNWRWFLIINWIFAIPEYYETFLAKSEHVQFQKIRKWLRPKPLLFFRP